MVLSRGLCCALFLIQMGTALPLSQQQNPAEEIILPVQTVHEQHFNALPVLVPAAAEPPQEMSRPHHRAQGREGSITGQFSAIATPERPRDSLGSPPGGIPLGHSRSSGQSHSPARRAPPPQAAGRPRGTGLRSPRRRDTPRDRRPQGETLLLQTPPQFRRALRTQDLRLYLPAFQPGQPEFGIPWLKTVKDHASAPGIALQLCRCLLSGLTQFV